MRVRAGVVAVVGGGNVYILFSCFVYACGRGCSLGAPIREVHQALNKTRGLYSRWLDLEQATAAGIETLPSPVTPSLGSGLPMLNSREELQWTSTELKNALRSIEWDLEDLEDTINIVEKNPNKFKIGNKELMIRRHFIERIREEVKIMKDKLNISKVRDRDLTARQPIIDNSPVKVLTVTHHGTAKYSKLENEIDSPNRQFVRDTICSQDSIKKLDKHLDIMSNNKGTLRTVSRHINSEFDEHQVMLDDYGNEMEIVNDSKLDATMKKMAKVLHISNDRRQWVATGVLTTVLLVVVILFVL